MSSGWSGVGLAEAYDVSFARLCAGAVAPLLDAVGAPKSRLLDAGCGTGIVAAAAVERGWSVDGVDIEDGMITVARRHIESARFDVGDLAHVPAADDTYDAVVAAFSLNHADHPRDCAGDLRRVANPGATIAVSVWPWQPTAMNQLWSEIMEATGTRPVDGFRLPANSDFERTEQGLTGLLDESGWTGARAWREAWDFRIAPHELWRGIQAGIATIGQAYADADDDGKSRIQAAYDERSDALIASDGLMTFPTEAVLATGVKP